MSGLIVIFKIKMLYNGFCWIVKKEDIFQSLCISSIFYGDTNIYISQLKGIIFNFGSL